MKRKVDSITKEKIEFIDGNSHVLNYLLNNRIGNNKTVIEVLTAVVINDKPLAECEDIDELKFLITINKDLCHQNEKDDSDSYWLIFNIAHYVNGVVTDKDLNNNIRDRLRIYTSCFKNGRTFSQNYRKFVILDEPKGNLMIKKIDV